MTDITSLSAVGAELRIITAGRTGFENDLRRNETIELIRARTALDAIGELANPIDDLSPSGTVILIGPDALIAGEEGEFIAAVRQIMPDVKIVHISENSGADDRFDGALSPGAPLDQLWNTLGIPALDTGGDHSQHGVVTPASSEPSKPLGLVDDTVEAPVQEPVEVHTRPIRPAAPSVVNEEKKTKPREVTRASLLFDPVDTLDEALLTVIRDDAEADEDTHESALDSALGGGDTLRAGLAELRVELGTETVRFTPGETADDGEPVKRGGRIFGALLADGIERAALGKSARWLADRLEIDAQLRALREAAFTDELTGAWNRRFFQRFLDRSVERARAERQDLSLMFFDIDDFKTYNDRYGHGAGDEILVEVVRLLETVIRPHDRVCRVGGDEFAVIFADGPREVSSRHPASIEMIARRFQRQICEHRFPKLGAEAMGTLTISGGLATFPWEAYDSATLIELADQLAMQSKRSGKNVITMGPGVDGVCDAMAGDGESGDQP